MSEPRGGVIVVDKPEGITSHDVVHTVRRVLGRVKVGHTGTLDPFATGVLPLVVGRATRLAQFFSGSDKEYLADIRLGAATDTYDVTGTVTFAPGKSAAAPTLPAIEQALASLAGTRNQMPPPFSAKRQGGVRAYTRARQGTPLDLSPVAVTAHAIRCVRFDGDVVQVHVHCSAGFYVRSLAHEIGEALGVGGHVAVLRRLRSGPFTLDQAERFEDVIRDPDGALSRIQPLDGLLPDIPAVVVTEEGARRIARGMLVGPAQFASAPAGALAARVRLIGPDGHLLGLADRQEGGVLHPGLVLV